MSSIVEGLVISALQTPSPDDSPVEVVERKGKGHPDTICDALAEEVSRALYRLYDESFGRPLHHNLDKALLWAGCAEPAFGGGEVVQPIRIFLAGRATVEFEGRRLPVPEAIVETAREWLRGNLHALDPVRHVQIEPLVRPASQELIELFAGQKTGGTILANDTSCGVGFAPLSELERVVLQVEGELTNPRTAVVHPEIGEDVKVMGVRRGDQIDLTVACAAVGRHVPDMDAYAEAKERVADISRQVAGRVTKRPVPVAVNVADDPARANVYLTVTGTSAEAGDDGQAGRGNRTSGLITPYRPMVMESAPGKNPLSHTGKVYTVAAQLMAQTLVDEVPEIDGAHCLLLSRIGEPIEEPHLVHVAVRTIDGETVEPLKSRVEGLIERRLGTLQDLGRDLAGGRISALSVHSRG